MPFLLARPFRAVLLVVVSLGALLGVAAAAHAFAAADGPDLQAGISRSATNPVKNTEFVYTLSAKNNGPGTATHVTLSDLLPNGLTYVSSDAGCMESGGDVTCRQDSLASGSTASFAVHVKPTQAGSLSNSVTVGSDDTVDPNGNDNFAYDDTFVTGSADLAIDASHSPASPLHGGRFNYTLKVDNKGPDVAGSVVVTDTLPDGVSFYSAGTGCTHDAGTVTCKADQLASGSSVSFIVTLNADAVGSEVNTPTVTAAGSDPEPNNNNDPDMVTIVAAADLSVAKTHSPEQAFRGEDLTYTLTATNAGPDDASSVVVKDDLPAGVDLVGASLPTGCISGVTPGGGTGTTVTCTKASLSPAAGSNTVSFAFKVKPNTSGSLNNTASVSSNTADPDNTNDTSAVDTTAVKQKNDLSATIAHTPDHPALNSKVTYLIGIANAGPYSADDVKVKDPLPAGVEYDSSPGCDKNTDNDTGVTTVTCSKSSLAANEKAYFEITVELVKAVEVKNSVTASSGSSDTDINPENNKSNTDTIGVEAKANLSLENTTFATARPGTNDPVQLKVTNNGPDDASGITVTDKLPDGLTFSYSNDGCTESNKIVTCKRSSTLPGTGDYRQASFMFFVKAAKSGTYTNTAKVTSDATDPNPDDNTASGTLTINGQADVSLAMGRTPAAPVAGGELNYALTVDNSEEGDAAENVKVTDTLPAGTSFVSADDECALKAGKVLCTLDELAGASAHTFHVKLKATQPGSVKNDATVATSSKDPNADNDSASDTAVVAAAPVAPASADLGLNITRDAPRVVRGIEAVYTLTAVNRGPSTATGAKITQTLPASVTFLGASKGCTRSKSTVTCTVGSLAKGARASYDVHVRPTRQGNISTRASVTSSVTDPDASDNTDTDNAYVEEPTVSRGRYVVCKVGHTGSACTVRYDGHGRPAVTGSLKRGSRVYATGSARGGKPLRVRSKNRIREGNYTLVRTYNGRSIKIDSVYVIVVQ